LLVDRENPKAIYPKVNYESIDWLRVMNSGMGSSEMDRNAIALKMGNPHANHLIPLRQGMVRRQRLKGSWCAMKA
jgi:hypothetical protein